MKHRLDDADDLSEANKETIFTMIDAKIADLENAKEQFDALGDDATSEEIQQQIVAGCNTTTTTTTNQN